MSLNILNQKLIIGNKILEKGQLSKVQERSDKHYDNHETALQKLIINSLKKKKVNH